jgi:hypothetical protein
MLTAIVAIYYSYGQSNLGGLDFDVLAPFPRGEREVADPLAAFGGILGIPRGGDQLYPSELADGGFIGWQSYQSDESGGLALNYSRGCGEWSTPGAPCVRLPFIGQSVDTSVYSIQGWAFATFTVAADSPPVQLVQCSGVMRFWIDEMEFRGDNRAATWWFGVNTWMVWPAELSAGQHTLRVQIWGSSFRCGFVDQDEFGQRPPFYTLMAQNPQAAIWNPGLAEIVPNVVSGHFAGEWLSIPIVNGGASAITSGLVSLSRDPVVFDRETGAVEVANVSSVTVASASFQRTIPGQGTLINIQVTSCMVLLHGVADVDLELTVSHHTRDAC